MPLFKQLNLALAFALEIAIAVALAYWAYHLPSPLPLKIVLAVLVPLLVAVAWALFLAPMARRRLTMPWLFIVKAAIFAGSAAALYSTGRTGLALVMAAIIAGHTALVVLWAQY
jgi:hypothetical protein